MYTEDEAQQKWCPKARILGRLSWRRPSAEANVFSEHEGVGTQNRGTAMGGALDSSRCIASKCMAWRWARTHVNNPEDPHGDLIPSTRTYGYCGAFGHPHKDANQ